MYKDISLVDLALSPAGTDFTSALQGAPTKRRNVSSIALRTLQQTILVDCGEATNRQMVIAGIDPLSVSNIFITHLHGDHCFGLPGMLTTISEARAGTNLAQVLSHSLHISGAFLCQNM